MTADDIRAFYEEVFTSYSKPSLIHHIKRYIELDQFLPLNSTFYCITNTQELTFEYVSKNMEACLGLDKKQLEEKGLPHLWTFIHPDDLEPWLGALKDLMRFTLSEIKPDERGLMSYTWNFRLKHGSGNYVNIIQNTTPLGFDDEHKPIIGLAHYTVLDADMFIGISASAKKLNSNNEYETLYFNTFSEKLLAQGISPRERDIIRLLALHKTSKEIAGRLNISVNTVDTHRRNILKKMKLSSTGELIGVIKGNNYLL